MRVVPQASQLLVRRLQFAQARFPSSFEFTRDEPVLWIGLHKLTLRQLRFVPQPFDLLLVRCDDLIVFRVGSLQGRRCHIDLGNTQRFKEPRNDRVVNRVAADPLTDRCSRLLLQMIAQVLRAALVLHTHFVSALAAVDDAVQQCLAIAWHAAGLVASILGVVVA
jgi:hypothetical protein